MIILFEDKNAKRGSGGLETPEARKRPLFGRTSRRKAQAVADVADGLLTTEEACVRYGVEADALATWQRALRNFGFRARRGKADIEE